MKCKFCTEMLLVIDQESFKQHLAEYHKIEDLGQLQITQLYEVFTLNPENSSGNFIPGQKIFSATMKVGSTISKWFTTKKEIKNATS